DKGTGAVQTIGAVYAHLGLTPDMTEASIVARVGNIPAEAEVSLRHALRAYLEGSKTDLDKAAALQPWLEQPPRRAALLPLYRTAFFTSIGELRKTLATKKVIEACPDIVAIMT